MVLIERAERRTVQPQKPERETMLTSDDAKLAGLLDQAEAAITEAFCLAAEGSELRQALSQALDGVMDAFEILHYETPK